MASRALVRHLLVAILLGACGGSPPPKAEASNQPSAPAASAFAKPEQKAAPESAAQPASTPATPAAPEVSKPSRPPIDTITAPKVAYVINYQSSAPHEAAEKKCDQAAGGKPEVRAQCMKKERSEFMADVIQFKKDAKDKVSWAVYRRKGETLFLVNRTPVELTDATDNTITVVITGEDKGARPLFAQKKKFVLQVPNDYSIELEDPFHGKLVYDAKVDVVGQGGSDKK